MSKLIFRGDIFWVKLDSTIGSEINKTRPALIVSNNAANRVSNQVIIAPITSKVIKIFPFEVEIEIKDKPSKILFNQIRAVDKTRLGGKIMSLDAQTMLLADKALKVALELI